MKKFIDPDKRTTKDWMNNEMWRKDLSKKELYEAAKFMRTFSQLCKVYPLHIVQKRKGV